MRGHLEGMLPARHTAVGCLCANLSRERGSRGVQPNESSEGKLSYNKAARWKPQMTTRHFPKPWTAEAAPGGYLVKDGNKLPLAYVYGGTPSRINALKLTTEEARDVAELIASVPELVERLEQGKTSSQQKSPASEATTGTLA